VNSLKRGLSNDATFDPPLFSLVNTIKKIFTDAEEKPVVFLNMVLLKISAEKYAEF
jgi:hypothetical protein